MGYIESVNTMTLPFFKGKIEDSNVDSQAMYKAISVLSTSYMKLYMNAQGSTTEETDDVVIDFDGSEFLEGQEVEAGFVTLSATYLLALSGVIDNSIILMSGDNKVGSIGFTDSICLMETVSDDESVKSIYGLMQLDSSEEDKKDRVLKHIGCDEAECDITEYVSQEMYVTDQTQIDKVKEQNAEAEKWHRFVKMVWVGNRNAYKKKLLSMYSILMPSYYQLYPPEVLLSKGSCYTISNGEITTERDGLPLTEFYSEFASSLRTSIIDYLSKLGYSKALTDGKGDLLKSFSVTQKILGISCGSNTFREVVTESFKGLRKTKKDEERGEYEEYDKVKGESVFGELCKHASALLKQQEAMGNFNYNPLPMLAIAHGGWIESDGQGNAKIKLYNCTGWEDYKKNYLDKHIEESMDNFFQAFAVSTGLDKLVKSMQPKFTTDEVRTIKEFAENLCVLYVANVISVAFVNHSVRPSVVDVETDSVETTVASAKIRFTHLRTKKQVEVKGGEDPILADLAVKVLNEKTPDGEDGLHAMCVLMRGNTRIGTTKLAYPKMIGRVDIRDGLELAVYDMEYIENESLMNCSPLYAYKGLDVTKRISGNSKDFGDGVLGIKDDETILQFKDNIAGDSWSHLICAGSRAGKGVMTLNILAKALSLGRPIFYLDAKPDMAGMFADICWELKTPMFLINTFKSFSDESLKLVYKELGIMRRPQLYDAIHESDARKGDVVARCLVFYMTLAKLIADMNSKPNEVKNQRVRDLFIGVKPMFIADEFKNQSLYYVSAFKESMYGAADRNKYKQGKLGEVDNKLRYRTNVMYCLQESMNTWTSWYNAGLNGDGARASDMVVITQELPLADRKDGEIKFTTSSPSKLNESYGAYAPHFLAWAIMPEGKTDAFMGYNDRFEETYYRDVGTDETNPARVKLTKVRRNFMYCDDLRESIQYLKNAPIDKGSKDKKLQYLRGEMLKSGKPSVDYFKPLLILNDLDCLLGGNGTEGQIDGMFGGTNKPLAYSTMKGILSENASKGVRNFESGRIKKGKGDIVDKDSAIYISQLKGNDKEKTEYIELLDNADPRIGFFDYIGDLLVEDDSSLEAVKVQIGKVLRMSFDMGNLLMEAIGYDGTCVDFIYDRDMKWVFTIAQLESAFKLFAENKPSHFEPFDYLDGGSDDNTEGNPEGSPEGSPEGYQTDDDLLRNLNGNPSPYPEPDEPEPEPNDLEPWGTDPEPEPTDPEPWGTDPDPEPDEPDPWDNLGKQMEKYEEEIPAMVDWLTEQIIEKIDSKYSGSKALASIFLGLVLKNNIIESMLDGVLPEEYHSAVKMEVEDKVNKHIRGIGEV